MSGELDGDYDDYNMDQWHDADICPACGGYGKVDGTGSTADDEMMERCEECAGTGELTR